MYKEVNGKIYCTDFKQGNDGYCSYFTGCKPFHIEPVEGEPAQDPNHREKSGDYCNKNYNCCKGVTK